MAVVTILGAGVMGSAMSLPASDRGHRIRLVGTHLDREIIDGVKSGDKIVIKGNYLLLQQSKGEQ